MLPMTLPLGGILGSNCSVREDKVCLARSGDVHRFALLLHALMPGNHVVLAVRNVFDLIVAAGVGLSKVWRGTDDDVASRRDLPDDAACMVDSFLAFRPGSGSAAR